MKNLQTIDVKYEKSMYKKLTSSSNTILQHKVKKQT